MELYKINNEIYDLINNGFNDKCIDMETGEIDVEKANALLEELVMNRDEKWENIALLIKDMNATIKAIKEEEQALKQRREQMDRKVETLKNYLTYSMQSMGELKFSTPKCALSFRKSQSVEIIDEMKIPTEYINEKITYSIDKTSIKDALKNGIEVDGATLVENQNIQIK